MTKTMPPTPPASRSPKGGPTVDRVKASDETIAKKKGEENIKEQGDHANIWQNTHNQGYQQDR